MWKVHSVRIPMQRTRHLTFLLFLAALVAIFWGPLCALVSLSLRRNEYSHIILTPFISVLLLYWRRREVFARSLCTCGPSAIAILVGVLLYGVARHVGVTVSQDVAPSFSLSILGFAITCVGAFIFVYGWSAFRAALFPLGFLLFLVPLPTVLLTRVVDFLQEGSSETAAIILRTVGVPFLRQGLVFRFADFSIEVAAECSGIRSSTALLITTLLAAQMFLRSNWKKLALCILVVPISIAKNGLRIATLSTLAAYVNRAFLFGRLHRDGGFVFFAIGLLVLWGALRLLQLGDNPIAPADRSPTFVGQPARKAEI